MSSEYWKLLQRPEWQRKRLEVFEAADFKCQYCGSKSDTLHAHHKIYRKGCKPWEYDLKDLECLCDLCHEHWHRVNDDLKEIITHLSITEMTEILAFGIAAAMQRGKAYKCKIATKPGLEGVAKYHGVAPDQLAKLLDQDGWVEHKAIVEYALSTKRRPSRVRR